MFERNAALASLAALTAAVVFAHGNPRAEVKAAVGKANVTIEYGRPSLKGRDMLGQASVGTVWRVGADKSATLACDNALAFGETSLAAGSYTLKARKDAESEWVLLLEADEAATEVPLVASALEESVELFTIELTGDGAQGSFELRWGTRALSTTFTAG